MIQPQLRSKTIANSPLPRCEDILHPITPFTVYYDGLVGKSRSQQVSKEVVLVTRPRMTFSLDPDIFEMLTSRIPPKDRSQVINAALRQYFAIKQPQMPPEDKDPPPVKDERTIEERRRIELAHKIFTECRVIGIMH